MSIHTEDLRSIGINHGWTVCEEVADELELCEKTCASLLDQRDRLLEALSFILRGMDGGHIKCAPYFDFDPDAAQIEFKHPSDKLRELLAKIEATK